MNKDIINTAKQVEYELEQLACPEEVANKKRFFKTAPGSYGEGDKFIAVSNGDLRKIAKKYLDLDFTELGKLLASEIHETRQTALFILVAKYDKAGKNHSYNPEMQKTVHNFYLEHLDAVNNWDLVDLSAHYIMGAFLLEKKDRSAIYKLADSKELWRERIAVIATFAFIREGEFDDTLRLAEKFLAHPHDLLHKAVGWMLREIGKRNQAIEEEFLKKHYLQMPRTMLRYAIERFPEKLRQEYLRKL
jgi:3-methyladenine DNA glycosylase AlkD